MKKPFKIHASSQTLSDLKQRLAHTRWPATTPNKDWKSGTDLAYLKDLCYFWEKDFNWQAQEDHINSFHHYTTEIDGHVIHFMHEEGEGKQRIPILLTHGYPDSFVRFLKLIPLLTKEQDSEFSFDVVVPSIPGYGFSSIPRQHGMASDKIAQLFVKLMRDELGYTKFIAHGGDWGSTITEAIARNYPEVLYGIHFTDVPFRHLFEVQPDDMSDAEKKFMEEGKKWQEAEGAYAMIQATKPQSLMTAFNDSPAGLAGWIIEKFHGWSNHEGDLETVFTKNELLTNIMIYWLSETIGSAISLYHEFYFQEMKIQEKKTEKVEVPTGAAIFPTDLVPTPREYGERFFNIIHWTQMNRGGHFAAMEEPELLASDICRFVEKVMGDKLRKKLVASSL